MMIVIVGIAGVIGILALAMKGNLEAGTVLDQGITVNIPDAVLDSVPSNSDGEHTADVSTDFNPGVTVPINPMNKDTWPGGDVIWDVARAIAIQEGYGVSAQNAPTRNNNPGDISDGFSQFGGEQLDSKITRFPDPETGWNWLYNKLKNVYNGRSSSYSNNMTWNEFAHKYASDPNWVFGVTRILHVKPTDRVGDYWNA